MARYRLTPLAERDLEGIWSFTAEKWDVSQAGTYIDKMLDAFAALANSPHLAQACDHIRPGYLRYRVGSHFVYFRMTSDGIAVVRILHHRMDPVRHT